MEQLSQHFVTVCSADSKQSKTDNITSMLEIDVTAMIHKEMNKIFRSKQSKS